MTQRLIIDSINFTFGKKQYQIELETGHIWDLSFGDFEETNIYLGSGLSSMVQECIYRIAQYEKHQNDWNDQENDECAEDAPSDNYVLRCKAHPDAPCNNRTASGDCSAPKLHCVYALEVKV